MKSFFEKLSHPAAILGILILALVLRLPLLSGSFWLDEAAQVLESARPLSQQLDIIPDFQPPLLHLVIHFALYVSTAEWWLRLVGALLPGLVTIWVTYKLGERLGSRLTGILAALLLATSSFHIFYSQELRPYSLPAMWAVLSWWSLLQATSVQKKDSLKPWFLFTLWSGLGLYSSFLYPFLMIGQGVWLLGAQRSYLKQFCLAAGIAVVSFVPWLPIFKLQLAAGGQVRQDLPGWAEVVSIPQLKSLPLVAGKFIFGVVDLDFNLMFAGLSLLVMLAAGWVLYHWWRQHPSPTAWRAIGLLLTWWLVPLAVAWIVSFWIPVVQPKRVLFLLPAYYLFISVLTTQLKTTRWWKYSLISVFLLINLWSTAQYFLNPWLQRENWRAAHTDIINRYPAHQSVAIFVFPEPFAPWRWYDDGSYPTLSTGTLHIDQVASLRDTLEPAMDTNYLIVFDYLRDLTDPNDQLVSEIEAYGYRNVELLEYPQIGFIRVYARPETVIGATR